MNLDDFETEVGAWHYFHFGAGVPPYKPMLKATEELGEVARAVNLGDPLSLMDEIGDVSFPSRQSPIVPGSTSTMR